MKLYSFNKKNHEVNVEKCKLFQLYKFQCEQTEAETTALTQELKDKIKGEQDKLKDKVAELNELEQQFEQAKQAHDTTAATMAKCKSDFAAFERKDVKYRESIKHKKTLLKKAEQKRVKLEESISELSDKKEKENTVVPKLQKKLDKLTEEKTQVESELEEIYQVIKEKTEGIRATMESKQKNLIPYRKKMNEVTAQHDQLKNQVELLKDKVTKALKEKTKIEENIEEEMKNKEKRTNEVKTLEKSLLASKTKLSDYQTELKTIEEQEEKGNARKTQLMTELEESKASQSSTKNRSVVLESLLKAKKKGILPGILGRLGDLASIDSKYDVAITTACPALNHIVVDNQQTGNKSVTFLKAHNIGRASFLILNTLSYLSNKLTSFTSTGTPENVPRLFDLIQLSPEVLRDNPTLPLAFYFATKDTLVADTLEQATRIAYGKDKRWRVVTLDGKLIDTAGTMSGGGNEVRKGGMTLASSARKANSASSSSSHDLLDVEALINESKKKEAELVELDKSLSSLRVRRRELESNEIPKLQREISSIETNIKKHKMAIDESATTLQEYTQRLESLKENMSLSADDQKKEKELLLEIQTAEAKLQEVKSSCSVLEDEIDTLQNQILAAGGSELKQKQKRVDELNKQVEETNNEIVKLTVGSESALKKLAKFQEELKEVEKEKETLEKEIEVLTNEFKQIEEDALVVMNAFKEAEESLKEREAQLENIQTEYQALKNNVQAIKTAQMDLAERLEEVEKKRKENASKTLAWKKKVDGLVKIIQATLKNMQKGLAGLLEEEENKAASSGDADAAEVAEEPEEKSNKGRGARLASRRQRQQDVEVDLEMEDAAAGQDGSDVTYTLLTSEELENLQENELKYNITLLEESLAQMKPNMRAIQDYLRKEKEYIQRAAALDAITKERDDVRKQYELLRKKRLDEFMAGFSTITMKLKEMYQMLTLGGDAELELVDSLDPFSEGIIFSVRPPKKSWKNITNLSGGEKTLSSLALVFALHHYKPTPLYVMDEIDAALDFKNVSIVANYIKERTKNAQFIIISLRNNMFELADRLVGIYKTNHVTKSITIDPRLFVVPQPKQETLTTNTSSNINKQTTVKEEKDAHLVQA